MILVSNAFSINMLNDYTYYTLTVNNLKIEEVKELLKNKKFKSVVGHENTSILLSKLLDIEIKYNRETVNLSLGRDELLVCQYSGPRLEEKVEELPKNSKIRFYYIK